jgi:hypothetical protein
MATRIKYGASARKTDRQKTETQVSCRIYTSSEVARAVTGVLRNYSAEGGYIETAHPIRIGTVLMLKLNPQAGEQPLAEAGEQPQPFCLMEVKWCQLLEVESLQRFGVGLHRLEIFT